MILHPSLAEGTITRYCGSLAGTTEGGRGNMLDPIEHFPDDCYDTGLTLPTPTPTTGQGSQRPPPSEEDMENLVRNLATEFMDKATGDTFLLRHLLADFHVVRGKQQTLIAQKKHGLLEPSQPDLYFLPNADGSSMSLKRRKDFLEKRR
jgi:hypothetical protein